jgi:hypothetical protein
MRCITTPGHRDRHHEMIGTGAALPSIYTEMNLCFDVWIVWSAPLRSALVTVLPAATSTFFESDETAGCMTF